MNHSSAKNLREYIEKAVNCHNPAYRAQIVKIESDNYKLRVTDDNTGLKWDCYTSQHVADLADGFKRWVPSVGERNPFGV